MRRALLAALLIVSCAGCAWKRELAQGDAAADQGAWLEAVTHYQAALELKPDDPELKARVAEAREQAVTSLLEQARAAQEGGASYEALDLLDQVEGLAPRHTELALLREEVIASLAAGVREPLGEQPELEQAWERFVPFAERFAVHPETARLREEIQGAVTARVEASIQAEAYAEAYTLVEGFEDRLPMEAVRAPLLAAWSASLTQEAAQASRARQHATAFVAMHFAQALSGENPDAEEIQGYRERFRKAYAPVLGPRLVAKDRAAMERLSDRVAKWSEPSMVRWMPGAPRPMLGGRITIAPLRWDQSDKQTVAVHEYAGPEREHENPDVTLAKASLAELETALAQAEQDQERIVASRAAQERSLESMLAGIDAVEQGLAGVRQAFAEAEAEANRAQAALDEAVGAKTSVEQLETQRAELQAAVVAAAGDAEAQAAAQAALDAAPKPTNLMRELARHVPTRAGQLTEKQQALEAARAQLETRQAPVQEQLDAVAAIEQRMVELVGELEEATARQVQLQGQIAAARTAIATLPPTVFGPTVERLEIPVQDHLRTCTGELLLELGPIEGRQVALSRKLVATAETRDEERPAVPEHGLEADPFEFPESDLELQARVELQLQRALIGQLDEQLALFGRDRLEAGLAAEGFEEKLAALLIAGWTASDEAEGEAPSERARANQAVDELLKAHWGVGTELYREQLFGRERR